MSVVITWTKNAGAGFSSSDDGSILSGADLGNLQSDIEGHSHIYTSLTVTNLSATNIIFPATQIPSANVNTLDDYEEGDWTAAFTCGTSGTITIDNSYKTGTYVKIGRMVIVTGFFMVASVSSPVGDLFITGLPFTCGNAYKFRSGVALWIDGLANNVAAPIMGIVIHNGTTISIGKLVTGAIAALAGDVQANTNFWINATYFTD